MNPLNKNKIKTISVIIVACLIIWIVDIIFILSTLELDIGYKTRHLLLDLKFPPKLVGWFSLFFIQFPVYIGCFISGLFMGKFLNYKKRKFVFIPAVIYSICDISMFFYFSLFRFTTKHSIWLYWLPTKFLEICIYILLLFFGFYITSKKL